MSPKSLEASMNSIVKRLAESGKWEEESLRDIINQLLADDDWNMPKICAYIDTLDIVERT